MPAFRSKTSRNFRLAAVCTLLACVAAGGTCSGVPSGSTTKNDLSSMRTVPIVITNRAAYTSYVADTSDTQLVGLMNTTEAELPESHGMIFVFQRDEYRSFWMRNTIIPLDIAYIQSSGRIVKTYTMQPLNESGYYSIEPARFVLEVRAGQFAAKGVVEGDHVEIPPELFNTGS
ncbi:MAG: DUF192 domain-containing protein [Planctomycetota bacterium]